MQLMAKKREKLKSHIKHNFSHQEYMDLAQGKDNTEEEELAEAMEMAHVNYGTREVGVLI